MLLSLAIADDIGAILVIALAYNSDVSVVALGAGFRGSGAGASASLGGHSPDPGVCDRRGMSGCAS